MIKSLIQGSELEPIFATVENPDSALGIVVHSHVHSDKSLFSRYLVREAAKGLNEQSNKRGVLVFDGESTLTTIIDALYSGNTNVQFDIVTTMAGGYGTAQCFLDLLEHNLNAAQCDVGMVLIDVPDLWPHLTSDTYLMSELPLWKGLKKLLLDKGIDFVLTKPAPHELLMSKDKAFDRDAVMQAAYDTFEIAALENREEPECFPISTGIYSPSENCDPTGTLVVYSSSDLFEYKVSRLVNLMYRLDKVG